MDNVKKTDQEIKSDVPKAELSVPVKMIYRYHCPACTGVAFLSSNMMPFTKIHCQKCEAELTECDMNNYFELEGSEYAAG